MVLVPFMSLSVRAQYIIARISAAVKLLVIIEVRKILIRLYLASGSGSEALSYHRFFSTRLGLTDVRLPHIFCPTQLVRESMEKESRGLR